MSVKQISPWQWIASSGCKERWGALCLCSQTAAIPWAPRASLWCQVRNRWLSRAGPHFIQCLHSTKHMLFSLVTVNFSFSKWKWSFIEWKKIVFKSTQLKLGSKLISSWETDPVWEAHKLWCSKYLNSLHCATEDRNLPAPEGNLLGLFSL